MCQKGECCSAQLHADPFLGLCFLPANEHFSSTHHPQIWRESPAGSSARTPGWAHQAGETVQTSQGSQVPLGQAPSLLKTQKTNSGQRSGRREMGRQSALRQCFLLLGPHISLTGISCFPIPPTPHPHRHPTPPTLLNVCYTLGEANGRSQSLGLFPLSNHILGWIILPLMWMQGYENSHLKFVCSSHTIYVIYMFSPNNL